MRNCGEAVAAIRVIVKGLVPGKIQLYSTLLASEAFTMPNGLTATELFVLINGLSATAAFVDAIGVDDRTMNGVASGAGLAIRGNAGVSNTSMMARTTINSVLASSTKKHTFVTRITEEARFTEVLLAFKAVEAIKVIVLGAHNLIQ